MSYQRPNRFLSFVERMRQKPKEVRQAYALGVASVVTGLIAVVWIGTIVVTGEYPGVTDEQRDQFAAVQDSSAQRFDMFKNEFVKQTEESPERERVKQLITQLQQQREQTASAAYGANSAFSASTTDGTYGEGTMSADPSDTSSSNLPASSSDNYGTNY